MDTNDPRESRVERLTLQLDQLEQDWIGRTIGIGYDADTDTGRIVITFEPQGAPALALRIVCDVDAVRVGRGDSN